MFGSVPLALDTSPEGVGVVAFVAVENTRSGQTVKKLFRRLAIGDLAAGQQEGERAAEVVCQGVDFR
jgi:hypothetical protein